MSTDQLRTDHPRDIRRAAFQALFQLDARNGDADAVRASGMDCDESADETDSLSESGRSRAFELAAAAFAQRAAADAELEVLAPLWPAARQASVDRAILRLAHYELVAGLVAPRLVVSEAVELAKQFSTEKSPAFVNALLDKVLRRLHPDEAAPADVPTPPGP